MLKFIGLIIIGGIMGLISNFILNTHPLITIMHVIIVGMLYEFTFIVIKVLKKC